MKSLTQNTITSIIIVIFLTLVYSAQSQCFSRNGIMNNQCSSLTINTPPYIEISIGQGIHNPSLFKNVTKIDINYITKDEIIYGGTFGIIPKTNSYEFKMNLGYNVAGCMMLYATYGITNITTIRINNEANPVIYKGLHSNIGIGCKLVSGHVVFGGYGSSTGIGVSFGIIINNK